MSIVISDKVRLVMTDADTTNFNFGTNQATEISILKGVNITQHMLSLKAKATGVSATPNRVTKAINTGYSGVELTFSTYLKPITDGANVSSAEKLLWESFSATDTTDTATESTISFSTGNTNKLRELFFYLILEDNSYYKVSNGVVASAEIDININSIATIKWTVLALDVVYKKEQNLLTYSQIFENSIWDENEIGMTTDNFAVAPDGTTTAAQIEDTLASFSRLIYNNTTIVDVFETHTYSIFVKKDAIIPATRFPRFNINYFGGTNENNFIQLNTSTGAFVSSLTDSNGAAVVYDYDTNWWRLAITCKAIDIATTGIFISIYPAAGANADLTTITGTATGSIIIWGAQINRGTEIYPYTEVEGTSIDISPTGTPKLLTDRIFIRNKLSTIALQINGVTYDLAILKASISLTNSVNLINRLKVGEIFTPSGHYVGDRTTNTKLSFYLDTKSLGSSTLITNLLNYTTLATINTLANATISIGGSSNALNVNVAMPTSKVTLANPTIGLYNTVEIELFPQESVIGAGDEISLEYNN